MFKKSSLEKVEACYKKGEYDDALKYLTEALEEKGVDRRRCQYFLGLACYEKGDYDKAIHNLKGTLELEPTNGKYYFIEKFIEHPEEAQTLGINLPSGLLLIGPPGTEKTTVARVLASVVNASFYMITPADVLSKWVGESEQRSKAAATTPARMR